MDPNDPRSTLHRSPLDHSDVPEVVLLEDGDATFPAPPDDPQWDWDAEVYRIHGFVPGEVRPTTAQSSKLNTAAARAQIQGEPAEALRLADQAIQANPNDPWPRYTRGMALARLGQTDEAITALSEAEQSFGPKDPWGRSIAMWGQAHTFAQAGRCTQARAAFDRYAGFVVSAEPRSADLARRYAAECGQGPVAPSQP